MRPAQREAGCAGLFRHSNAPGESQGHFHFKKINLRKNEILFDKQKII